MGDAKWGFLVQDRDQTQDLVIMGMNTEATSQDYFVVT
jgi:hypothetical protein